MPKKAMLKSNPIEIGSIVLIAQYDDDEGKTIWVDAEVISMAPMIAMMDNGDADRIETPLAGILWKRTDRKVQSAMNQGESTPRAYSDEVQPYVDALVQIINEGMTKTPNATVKRMINIAKAQLGELPI